MATAQAILYLFAVALLVGAALELTAKVRLEWLGLAVAVLAYSLPQIASGL
jgi:hypothetical protein